MNLTSANLSARSGAARGRQGLEGADLDALRAFVRAASGIELDEGKEYLIESRLAPVVRQHGLADIAELVTLIADTTRRDLRCAVVDAMTTNETSFFRDNHPWNALADSIIPDVLAGGDGSLTVWCGASSSGQEPYTLAMLLVDRFPDLVRSGRVRIVATDLSPTMVARTAEGRFSQLEVNRGLPATSLLEHFTQAGRDWVASDRLRSMIEVRQLNLLERWADVPRSDLVLLRNVLIYFSLETKQDILRRIRTNVLAPHGYLLLGSSETTLGVDTAYESRTFGRTICYRHARSQP